MEAHAMSPTPDKSVKRATLQFSVDLPANYEEFDADQKRAVRRAFKQAVTRHPDETDATAGTAMAALTRGASPHAAGLAWSDAELVAKDGYPSQAELRAFVSARLAGYNAAIRAPRGEGDVELAPESAATDSGGATSGATTGATSTGAPGGSHTDPGTLSDPHDGPGGPGGPRVVRYRIIDGKLHCYYGYWLLVTEQSAGGASGPPPRPHTLEVDAGAPLSLAIYAEVGFTSA